MQISYPKKTSIPIPWPGYVQMTHQWWSVCERTTWPLKGHPWGRVVSPKSCHRIFMGYLWFYNTIFGEILMEYPLVNTYHTTFGGMNWRTFINLRYSHVNRRGTGCWPRPHRRKIPMSTNWRSQINVQCGLPQTWSGSWLIRFRNGQTYGEKLTIGVPQNRRCSPRKLRMKPPAIAKICQSKPWEQLGRTPAKHGYSKSNCGAWFCLMGELESGDVLCVYIYMIDICLVATGSFQWPFVISS